MQILLSCMGKRNSRVRPFWERSWKFFEQITSQPPGSQSSSPLQWTSGQGHCIASAKALKCFTQCYQTFFRELTSLAPWSWHLSWYELWKRKRLTKELFHLSLQWRVISSGLTFPLRYSSCLVLCGQGSARELFCALPTTQQPAAVQEGEVFPFILLIFMQFSIQYRKRGKQLLCQNIPKNLLAMMVAKHSEKFRYQKDFGRVCTVHFDARHWVRLGSVPNHCFKVNLPAPEQEFLEYL